MPPATVNTHGCKGKGGDLGSGKGGTVGDSASRPHALKHAALPVHTEWHVAAQISFIPLERV